ncbi:hypothetical protein [Paenibacillus sinopodophylli]|uniref:hypothetical protein n=1 Tax=Paenibacillus sinopodophylli TaxID=1837342 RepID=UPI00110D15A8|nr:hypothetical protein [Paenibacillus sinopodophylli]
MSKFKKIISLSLLLTLCLFPTTAFASSNKDTSDHKKSFISSIFSVFTVTKNNNSNSNNQSNYNSSNHYSNDKDWNNKGWFDWWDDDDWWDEICWWDKHKDDSYKIWERYYCY